MRHSKPLISPRHSTLHFTSTWTQAHYLHRSLLSPFRDRETLQTRKRAHFGIVIIESAEFTFPMWLKRYEEHSHLEGYRGKAAESFAPPLLGRYKQLARARPQTPGKGALIPSCPPVLKYHKKTLERHLQLLLDIATGILDHQTQDSLGKLISAMLHEALR